ncbi:MAG: hypothetical protein ACU0CA_11435 [Paracoccaceae bacterium]
MTNPIFPHTARNIRARIMSDCYCTTGLVRDARSVSKAMHFDPVREMTDVCH